MTIKRLSRPEALQLIRKCLQPGRRVIPGKHFRDELENEGLTLSDALYVLRTGQIYDEPEQDIKTGEWKYRIEGTEVDGRVLKIVFCFKDFNQIKNFEQIDTAYLITVFASARRQR